MSYNQRFCHIKQWKKKNIKPIQIIKLICVNGWFGGAYGSDAGVVCVCTTVEPTKCACVSIATVAGGVSPGEGALVDIAGITAVAIFGDVE